MLTMRRSPLAAFEELKDLEGKGNDVIVVQLNGQRQRVQCGKLGFARTSVRGASRPTFILRINYCHEHFADEAPPPEDRSKTVVITWDWHSSTWDSHPDKVVGYCRHLLNFYEITVMKP